MLKEGMLYKVSAIINNITYSKLELYESPFNVDPSGTDSISIEQPKIDDIFLALESRRLENNDRNNRISYDNKIIYKGKVCYLTTFLEEKDFFFQEIDAD